MKTLQLFARWQGPAIFISSLLLLGGCSTPSTERASTKAMKIDHQVFGKMPDGTEVKIYTLSNSKGTVAKVTEYGAILTELWVPDRNGKLGNVVLGFDNLDRYVKGHPFFGATTGRVANRIAKGKFTLEGKEYTLAVNNGPNHLHGGKVGFDKRVWKSRPLRGVAR